MKKKPWECRRCGAKVAYGTEGRMFLIRGKIVCVLCITKSDLGSFLEWCRMTRLRAQALRDIYRQKTW